MERQEYGGFLEIEHAYGPEFYDQAIPLNSGRNCLRYLIRAMNIKKIALPVWNCDAVEQVCAEEGIDITFYSIGPDFLPDHDFELKESAYFYLVNYYGQLTEYQILKLKEKYSRVILDNAQAFFERPPEGISTIYTCRKFIGVPDGGYLMHDLSETECRNRVPGMNNLMEDCLEVDDSSGSLSFLYGRLEKGARNHYSDFQINEKRVASLPLRKMSYTTHNILRSADYEQIQQRRRENFECLAQELSSINQLSLHNNHGPYMYPFLGKDGSGPGIRKKMLERNIYIPVLWPNILRNSTPSSCEYYLTDNIIPLPCDQRYSVEDMKYIAHLVKRYFE